MGRLTKKPHDIIVYGRAVGMRHVEGRDDATPEDISIRTWKKKWLHYVRVHHPEFVAGTLSNGVPLGALMDALKADTFISTQRHVATGKGNLNLILP